MEGELKITSDMAKELAEKLAELIMQEISSEHKAALLIHEGEIEVFIKLRELVNRRNPIEGTSLAALRKGLDLIWEEAKVLRGSDMDLIARSLDVAQRHDENIKASEKSYLANSY